MLIAVATFVAVAVLTWGLLNAPSPLRVLAHPNRRSSHAVPTPTAGGAAFVVVVVCWLALFAEDYPPAMPLALGGTLVAALGLVDDVREVHAGIRLACHALVVSACVVWLVDAGVLLGVGLVVGLVWWLNLYNFMDGIDGIAASQAAAFAGGALLLADAGSSQPFAAVLVAASAGFLLFNWAPAKIFMGDAGSGFLGLLTGVLALWLWQAGELAPVASAILLLAFWFDATYTLIVRAVTGQAFASAHRSHLYQVLGRRLGHGRAVGIFWVHWLAWLLPLAFVASRFPRWQFACLALACAPIAVACVRLRAGAEEPVEGNGAASC